MKWVNIGVPGLFLSAKHSGNTSFSVGILIHLKNMILELDYILNIKHSSSQRAV